MRKLVLIVLPLAVVASPAMAQAATSGSTGQVDISGSVAGRCLFTTPSKTITLGELALSGSTAAAGKLDTAKVDTKSETLVGWCNNAAATMTVTTTELTNTAPIATGFDNRIDYTATAVANSATASDSSLTAGAGTSVTVGLFTGNVVVTLSGSSTPNSGLLVAGGYSGNVKVTLAPLIAL